MSNDKQFLKNSELILLALDGQLSDEQFSDFDRQLQEDSSFRQYYLRFMALNTSLGAIDKFPTVREDAEDNPFLNQDLWLELAQEEKAALAIEIEKPTEKPTEKSGEEQIIKTVRQKRQISRFSIYTLTLSAAAILLLIAVVLFTPVRPIVGTLTDTINAEWVNHEQIPARWDVVRQGEMTLASGFAEITFNDGAIVVVEGPAVIELESPKSMFVTSGKISAVVSEYATGFMVNTLSASIVDLGTEFGVSVEGDGSCSLHMFKGKANLIVGQKGQKRKGQIVRVNEARNVNRATGNVQDIELGEKSFVRHIDSVKGFIWRGGDLDLADVIGGGNGFGTGKLGVSINPDTGEVQDGFVRRAGVGVSGVGNYVPMKTAAGVDGVFVPDGGQGKVIVTSMGHVFHECPDTSGRYCWNIYNGNSGIINGEFRNKLDGTEFGTADSPAITVHANSGITFDLGKIRSKVLGCEITAFKSKCGVIDRAKSSLSLNKARFWVLVDGQVRYRSEEVSRRDSAEEIKVKLTKRNKFLTLIVDEASSKKQSRPGDDWVVFAEPRLKLK